MPQDQSPRSTALWEQLLQRISGTESHEYDLFRVELLELVADNLTNSDHFFARFGTIINRCIAANIVAVWRAEKSEPLFSSVSKSVHHKVLGQLPSVNSGAYTVSDHKLKTPVLSQTNQEPIRFAYQLPLDYDTGWVYLLVATDEPLTIEHRKYLHFISLLLGIRRRRQLLQNQLSQEQQRLMALTHHLSEGLVVLNPDFNVTVWNKPLHHLTGYSLRETIGRPVDQFLPQNGGVDWLRQLVTVNSFKSGGNVFHSDIQLKTKRNELKWVNVSGSLIRDSEGVVAQIIVLIRDITHLKELEQRKNEFISIATHELRTPITAIKGYLSLLNKEAPSFSDKQQVYLERAVEASERLVKLAEDLLRVVRVEENRVQFTCKKTNLGSLITKVSRDFSEKAAQKNIDLRVTKPAAPVSVLIDRVRTEQVIANLIDNALKYTRRGQVQVILRQDIKEDNKEWAVVDIIDSGVGIDQKELSGIFEKFHRTRSATNSRESGVGLGLYIVKSFIEMQKGRISVSSRLKKGSTFTVSFPVIKSNKKVKEIK